MSLVSVVLISILIVSITKVIMRCAWSIGAVVISWLVLWGYCVPDFFGKFCFVWRIYNETNDDI